MIKLLIYHGMGLSCSMERSFCMLSVSYGGGTYGADATGKQTQQQGQRSNVKITRSHITLALAKFQFASCDF